MPEKATQQRAARAKRSGKSASTQAGEFVREEMHHIREGKHGAKTAKQAIAIGLAKARKSGVKVKRKGKAAAKPTRKSRSTSTARRSASRRSGESKATRSKAATRALKRQPRRAASHRALSRQAHAAAGKRTQAQRSASARKAARTRARAH